MKHLKKLIIAFTVSAVLLATPFLAFSLPGDDCDPLDPACPIDGGLVALLAVGVGYGVKKVRDAKKESPDL